MKQDSQSGTLNDLESSFLWSGKPEGERREAGAGFAIKKNIVTKLTEMPQPISDRIMTTRLPRYNYQRVITTRAVLPHIRIETPFGCQSNYEIE